MCLYTMPHTLTRTEQYPIRKTKCWQYHCSMLVQVIFSLTTQLRPILTLYMLTDL